MSPLYEHLNRPEGHWLRDLLLLSVLLGSLFLAGLGTAPLIDPDEGRYAEIPREMLEKGDFITPTLNYVKYFEKPPLIYWANAGSMAVFGQTEFAARLPSALSGLLTILILYVAGRKLYDRRTGLLAALILGSSAGFLLQSRIILTDMLLTLCLSTALFAFILAVNTTGIARRLWFYLFFGGCGLAVLAKGLIGIVLPGGILFWYIILSRQWRLLRDIPWLTGCFLFLAVTAPWFLLVSQQNPEFPHFFFIREHFQRFTSTIHKRQQPFWFFLPMLLVVILPWSFTLPGSLAKAITNRFQRYGTSLYLVIWPLVILLFFSLSSSKLIPYILPVLPPLALLIAHRFSEAWHLRNAGLNQAIGILGSILMIAGILVTVMPLLTALQPILATSGQTGRQFSELLYGPSAVLSVKITSLIGIFFAVPGLALLVALRKRSVGLIFSLLCLFGILLEIALPILFTRFIADQLSHRSLAMVASKHLTSATLLAQSGPRQGLSFYLKRRLITVGDADEMTFGSQQGDQRDWFMTMDSFKQLWTSGRHVMIVLRPDEARVLLALPGNTAQTLASTNQAILLSNR